LTGSYIINATVMFEERTEGVQNITFLAFCTGTANSTNTILGTNATGNVTGSGNESFTITYDTTFLEDASVCTFNATYYNVTGNATDSDTSTAVIVDNTVPTTPTSCTNGRQTNSDLPFTCTVSGSKTTACTISFLNTNPPGVGSVSHTSDSCSVTVNNLPPGTYEYKMTASDGKDTAQTGKQTVTLDGKGGQSPAQRESIGRDTTSRAVSVEPGNLISGINRFIQGIIDWIKGVAG
jgi:hypothetical protein